MLARAKINLMLQVTGRRDDGYHLLQSLTCFADIGDDITLTPSESFSLQVTGEFAGALSGENLIERAAHALAKHCNLRPHGSITLEKKLPIGAGLGGGSADAALALRLLAGYWGYDIPASLAASLGSDIPACLHNAPCWMEGVGEQLTPIHLPFDIHVLLVNPSVAVATQNVYQRLAPPYSPAMALPIQFADQEALVSFLARTHNALETPAKAIAPVIGDVLTALGALPHCQLARMSGSGATCFGVFDSPRACEAAAHTLQNAHASWWIKPTLLRGTHGQA